MVNYYTAQRSKLEKLIDVRTGVPKKPQFTADMRQCVELWGFLREFMAENIRNKVR